MLGGGGGRVCFWSRPISVGWGRGSKRSAPLFPGPQGEPAHGLHPRFVVAEIWADRGQKGGGGACAGACVAGLRPAWGTPSRTGTGASTGRCFPANDRGQGGGGGVATGPLSAPNHPKGAGPTSHCGGPSPTRRRWATNRPSSANRRRLCVNRRRRPESATDDPPPSRVEKPGGAVLGRGHAAHTRSYPGKAGGGEGGAV